VVVLAHGLAGASDENYIRSFCDCAARNRGWRVVVYNRRGHGDTALNMPHLTLGQAAQAEGRSEGSTPRAGAGGGGLSRSASLAAAGGGGGGLSRSGSLAELSGLGARGPCARNEGADENARRTWPRYGDTADMVRLPRRALRCARVTDGPPPPRSTW